MNVIVEFAGIVGLQPPCEYHIQRMIGKGSFATVYLMIQSATSRVVVGKFMETSQMTEKNKAFALAEARNSASCRHPNIIEYVASYQSPAGHLLLIFEFADAGDLSVQVNYRAPSRFFKENEILMIVAQLCLALHYLHEKNVIHRDIKTSNVFLTTSGLIKLGDFGLARQYDTTVESDVGSTFCGTPFYLAPELWNQTAYSSKADMWSLGVVMYELMALKKPFAGATMKDLVQSVVGGVFEPLPPFYSAEVTEIVYRLLSVDSQKRPSVLELIHHPLVQTLGLQQLRRSLPRLVAVDERIRESLAQEIDNFLLPDEVPPTSSTTTTTDDVS